MKFEGSVGIQIFDKVVLKSLKYPLGTRPPSGTDGGLTTPTQRSTWRRQRRSVILPWTP